MNTRHNPQVTAEPFATTVPQQQVDFEKFRVIMDNLEQEVQEVQSPETQKADARNPSTYVDASDVTAPVTHQAPAPKPAPAPVPATPAKRTTKGKGATNMQPLQATAPSANAPTFAKYLEDVTVLGEQAGLGKDTQIKFAMKVLEGGYLGTLDLAKDKHGPDLRDGKVLSEAYVKAQNKAVIFDAKAPNQRKLIANTDKFIKFGGTTIWGSGQPLQIANEVLTLRQNLKKQGKKVDDAYNTLTRFATKQLRSNTLFSGEELQQFCLKKESDPRTAEEVLEAIRKTVTKLMKGEVSNCPDMDDSDEVKAIARACTKRLSAIAKARGADKPGAHGPAPATAASPQA